MSLKYHEKTVSEKVDYRHLFSECPVAMYVFDEQTFEILEVNTSALIQYGYTRSEFLSMTALQLRPVQDIKPFIEVNKTLPPEYYDAGIWRHKKKNGEIFYVHIFSHKTRFKDRKSVLALSLDVNKQVSNEKQLEETLTKLEKQHQKLKYYAFINSHKIRNHVANILGLSALYEEAKSEPEANEFIMQNIKICASKLDEVLKEIALEIELDKKT